MTYLFVFPWQRDRSCLVWASLLIQIKMNGSGWEIWKWNSEKKKKPLNSHTSQPKLSFLLPDYLGLLVQVEVQNVILSFEVFKMSFFELTLSRQHNYYLSTVKHWWDHNWTNVIVSLLINFQWTSLKHIALFFTFFKGYRHD